MEEGSGFGCGRGVLGFQGRASGGAEGTQGLRAPALIKVVLGNGLGLGGVEGGSLIEVVGEPLLDDLVSLCLLRTHGELGLGWPSGWMDERGRGGLTDVGEDSGDRLWVGENRSEAVFAEGVAVGG